MSRKGEKKHSAMKAASGMGPTVGGSLLMMSIVEVVWNFLVTVVVASGFQSMDYICSLISYAFVKLVKSLKYGS